MKDRPEHVPADIGCEICGTCLGCDGCADPDNPIDLARGDCEACGTCGPCIADCRALRLSQSSGSWTGQAAGATSADTTATR